MKAKTELEPFLEPLRDGFLSVTPEEIVAAFGSLLSPVDSRALTGELAPLLPPHLREGLKEGMLGQRDDDLGFVRPRGFTLSEIKVRTQVRQGGQDRMVPSVHGEWLAARLSRADIHLERAEGHISLVGRYPAVHEWLDSHF